MPIPLVAIASALVAGGTLIPHAAGGMIVTAAAGGYIAGTYISTAGIVGLIAAATTTIGAGATILSGTFATLVGSAGIFGTTVGATGITGALMGAGILPATPVAIPLLAGGALIAFAVTAYRLFRLKWKLRKVAVESNPTEELERMSENEMHFSAFEAKLIEAIIKLLTKKMGGLGDDTLRK